MRPRASWMTGNDIPILEFLEKYPLALTPREIDYNMETREGVNISYSTVNRRLKQLVEKGLVQKEDEKGGLYSITDYGLEYLAGNVSKEDLEDDGDQ